MLSIDKLDVIMFEKLFEGSDKFLLKIDKDTKILDCNQSFLPMCKKFEYLKDIITYTHLNDFYNYFDTLSLANPIVKFTTNFCFDKNDVEDIPSTYDMVMYFVENEIFVIADPKAPLSHDDAKLYLNLVNDYSKNSRELTKTKLKLQYLNEQLENEVQRQVNEIRQKDEMILKQSKDAAMGEIIDSIAHQWKNPLNTMKVFSQSIKLEYELFDVPQEDRIIDHAQKIEDQIDHLVETLDEFRLFFRPNIPVQEVSIRSLIQSVHVLMKDELLRHKINIQTIGELDTKISIVPNQFKHVLINLISNSKDAFIDNAIENRLITFEVLQKENKTVLKICDNAGGIPEDIIGSVFEANFTTKELGKGTGIGLYMTKQIIDRSQATILVYNVPNGACFEIIF